MLNPILFTERVVQDYLRYQHTAYRSPTRASMPRCGSLLNLEEARRSPLLKGPYVCQSHTFGKA